MDLHLDLYKQLMGEELPMGIFILTDGGCRGNNLPAERMNERVMYGSFVVIVDRKVIPSTFMLEKKLVHREDPLPDCGYASSPFAECLMTVTAMEYVAQLLDRRWEQAKPKHLGEITILQDNEMAIGFARGEKQPDLKKPMMVERHKAIMGHPLRAQLKFKYVHNEWVKAILGH